MRFKAKAKSRGESWGMGFLLVFFSEENAIIKKKTTNLFSSSSTPSSSPSSPSPSSCKTTTTKINTLIRRTNSNHLLTKAQSTITLCALLIFITFFLFTLSTFEPTTTTSTTHFNSRRHLSSNSQLLYKSTQYRVNRPNRNSPLSMNFLKPNPHYQPKITSISHALQGMGTLYARGTWAMKDLIVCHVVESLTVHELRLFLRVIHRSGLTSRSDLVFIFPSTSISFDTAISEETESLLRLVHQYKQFNDTSMNSMTSFDMTQFLKSSKKEKERAEPIWGPRIRSNYSEDGETELTRLSYGSVVGFGVDELDPENSLAGFLDHIPMSLRRWACYPMLLGRVRRNFKHVMLVDVKDVLLLGDPLGRVRNRNSESVYLSTMSQTVPSNHGRKNSDKTQSLHQKLVNPAVITGGARGIRRLSNAMLTQVVRAAMQQKRKNSVSESELLSQLVRDGLILKSIKLVLSPESMPDVSSLSGLSLNSDYSLSLPHYAVVSRGNSNIDPSAIIMKYICSFPLDSLIYTDC